MNKTIQDSGLGVFFADLYKKNIDQIKTGASDYINNVRENALQNFVNIGIPTKKVEKYK